jgi:hypothetical protein
MRRGYGQKLIHFADKADREIGTARCGARLDGAHHTDDHQKVTCLKCGGAATTDTKNDYADLEREYRMLSDRLSARETELAQCNAKSAGLLKALEIMSKLAFERN